MPLIHRIMSLRDRKCNKMIGNPQHYGVRWVQGVSGARMGVGMLRGRGISLLENEKVSKFQKFKVSKFHSFKVSNFEIAIFRILKTVGFELSKWFGHTLPNTFNITNTQKFEDHILKTFLGFSWISWSVLVPPKINNIGFGSHGHVRQVQRPRTWWGWEFSNDGSSKLLVQKEAE